MKSRAFIVTGAFLLALAACKKDPTNRLVNPLASGVVPQSSGIFTIYDDELKTGGGAGFIPGGENQSLDFSDQSAPHGGHSQVRYSWTGGDVFNPDTQTSSHTFAGFSLLVSPNFATIGAFAAKDLSAPGYTKMKLRVRGSLSAGNSFRIEGPATDPPSFTPARKELSASDLTSDWQDVALTVPSGNFSSVKVFATFSIQYAQPPRTTDPGEGGTIYLDDIRYER